MSENFIASDYQINKNVKSSFHEHFKYVDEIITF